jgi:hypothetical protein
VSEGAVLATCALFGVCYRYMVRKDVQNLHLKGGVVAAFGLTRGELTWAVGLTFNMDRLCERAVLQQRF